VKVGGEGGGGGFLENERGVAFLRLEDVGCIAVLRVLHSHGIRVGGFQEHVVVV